MALTRCPGVGSGGCTISDISRGSGGAGGRRAVPSREACVAVWLVAGDLHRHAAGPVPGHELHTGQPREATLRVMISMSNDNFFPGPIWKRPIGPQTQGSDVETSPIIVQSQLLVTVIGPNARLHAQFAHFDFDLTRLDRRLRGMCVRRSFRRNMRRHYVFPVGLGCPSGIASVGGARCARGGLRRAVRVTAGIVARRRSTFPSVYTRG